MRRLFATLALGGIVAAIQVPVVAQAHDPQLERIRRVLAANGLTVSLPEPTFHVDVDVKARRLEIPVDPKAYSGGPRIPSGLYAFQMRQQLGNPWAGQPLIKVDVLPLARLAAHAARNAQQTRRQHATQTEVAAALATFCTLNDCTRIEPPRD